jgi:hypothetical protein
MFITSVSLDEQYVPPPTLRFMTTENCSGRLEEPTLHAFTCSLDRGCGVSQSLWRSWYATQDHRLAQQLRDAHRDRGAPAWVTEEDSL